MNFCVMRLAQPAYLQRLVVVIVVRVNSCCAAHFARLFHESSIGKSVLYFFICPQFMSIGLLPTLYPFYILSSPQAIFFSKNSLLFFGAFLI